MTMNTTRIFQLSCLVFILLVITAVVAVAEEFIKGTVKKVDAEKSKVTIIHEEIPSLDMPAMTMVFKTASEEMAQSLNAGDEIEFLAERVEGKLTVTEIKE